MLAVSFAPSYLLLFIDRDGIILPYTHQGIQRPLVREVFQDFSELCASHMTQWLRICLPIQEPLETQVQSLGWEDLQEKMATHSSILAWEIPRAEKPGRLQSMESQRVRHD